MVSAMLTAEACKAKGMQVPHLSITTIKALQSITPPRAIVNNPIDLSSEYSIKHYKDVLAVVLNDNNVDIAIVIYIPQIPQLSEDFTNVIREMVPEYKQKGKLLVTSFLGLSGARVELNSQEKGFVPSFAFPESTANTLARVLEFSQRLKKPVGNVPKFTDINKEKAELIIKSALEKAGTTQIWLDAEAILGLFECYGINFVTLRLAKTPAEAIASATEIGYP